VKDYDPRVLAIALSREYTEFRPPFGFRIIWGRPDLGVFVAAPREPKLKRRDDGSEYITVVTKNKKKVKVTFFDAFTQYV
jgi:hypothetical protein